MAKNRRRQRRLNGWRVLLLSIIAGLLYLVVLPVRIFYAGQRDDLKMHPEKADVIIILGSAQMNGHPSPILQGRLEHAVRLYQQGYARYVLFTGGKRAGDLYTEADTGRRFAVRRGVPESAILLESEGHTTMQSLQRSTEIMRKHGLSRAIVVSDPFHAFRLRRMSRDLGLDARVSPTPYTRIRSPWNQVKFTASELPKYTLYRLFGV